MQIDTGLKSWTWILLYWVIVYMSLNSIALLLAVHISPAYYLLILVVGIPLAVIPAVYRRLVGGACSLRFHICALVRGVLIGFIFIALSLAADTLLWTYLESLTGLSPSIYSGSAVIIYQVWLFSAIIGGFGARIIEVRGETMSGSTGISIAGHE